MSFVYYKVVVLVYLSLELKVCFVTNNYCTVFFGFQLQFVSKKKCMSAIVARSKLFSVCKIICSRANHMVN